jgi:hypothetical protein
MLAKKKSTKTKTVRSKKQKKAKQQKAMMALASEPTVDDVLHQWLTQSVPGQPIPDVDQLQVAWANFGSGGAFTVQVQQNLANLLNTAFSPSPAVVVANLPGTLTVGQLKLNLHRSA